MSLIRDFLAQFVPCFPRVSGDEPRIEVEMPASAQFSPRERG